MTRRGLFGLLAGAIAGATLDPYCYFYPVRDDDPTGVEVDDQLWADFQSAEKRYEELKDKIEALEKK